MNKKVKSLIIILIVLIVLGGGFFAGIRYYNGVKEFGYQSKIYYEDSFSNDQANSIRLINPQGDKTKIIPGEKVGFEINFKNNGTLQVSYLRLH